MADNIEITPSKKMITPKKTPKVKSDVVFKSKTKLYLLHECDACTIKFKSPAGLKKHKQLNHEQNTESKTRAKKKLIKPAAGAHSGVPPNPNLRKAFKGLKAKLENIKS